jgi:hypothetical protein
LSVSNAATCSRRVTAHATPHRNRIGLDPHLERLHFDRWVVTKVNSKHVNVLQKQGTQTLCFVASEADDFSFSCFRHQDAENDVALLRTHRLEIFDANWWEFDYGHRAFEAIVGVEIRHVWWIQALGHEYLDPGQHCHRFVRRS